MDRKSCRSSQLDDEDGRWCSGAFWKNRLPWHGPWGKENDASSPDRSDFAAG